MVPRPRAASVHDLGEGGIAVSSRFDDRPFVGFDEGVDIARLVVVEKGAVVMDHVVPALLAR